MSSILAALVAGGIFLFLWRSRRSYETLPQLPPIDDSDSPGELNADLIVIVPARNEERNISRVVSSFPPGWVLVVDDESTDRTAELARANTAEVLEAPRLMGGRVGKPNACAAGARATASEWILFVDADTWYGPQFLAAIFAYAVRERADLVTVFPRQVTKGLWEKILLPYAFALYFCGVNPQRVVDPQVPDALANGQCMLFRRSFYDFIGGHDAVAKSVIEDVALAALTKRHRGQIRILRAEQSAFVRMYRGLGEIWRGFTKNSFRFLQANPATGAQVIGASILLASWLPVLVMLLIEERWIVAGLFAAVPGVALSAWYGSIGASLLAAPFAIYVFQAIALHGMVVALFNRTTRWKGRPV